jgi:hypothetical protein
MMQLLNGDLLRSIRVLVVDDYEDWRNQVRLVLHFRGTIPIEASRSHPLRKAVPLPIAPTRAVAVSRAGR